MNSFLRSRYLQILTVVLVAQAALFYTASHGESTPLPQPLSSLPGSFGNWKMLGDGVVDDDTKSVLRADDLLTRDFTGPAPHANLFIAYFKTQRSGQSPHSPKNCLPGSGFQPVDGENGRIDVPVADGSIRINRYVVARGADESVVMYWYQSQGRVIADEFAAKFYLVADSIRRHRSDTSLVRVVVPVNGISREQAKTAAVDLVQAVYPVVSSWLPR